MMRYSIFAKAEKLKDEVKLESETKDKAYFDIDGKKLCLVCNGKYTYIESCTCMSHSIHGGITDMKHLCAYTIALMKHLSGRAGAIADVGENKSQSLSQGGSSPLSATKRGV